VDFQVIQFDETTGLARMALPAVPKKISGNDKLVQIVVLSFLRNSGRDVFAPVEGSGLRSAMGQYNFVGVGEIRTLCIQRTKVVESEVISRQRSDVGTPEERLKKLIVLDVATDETTGETLMRVQIINEAGDVTDVLV
jgi:hypothetical protein